MDTYNATTAREGPQRRRLVLELLGSIGEGTAIRPPLYVDYGSHISVGARCFANFGLVAIDVAAITIGDDAQIGPGVHLLTPPRTRWSRNPDAPSGRLRRRFSSGTVSGSAAGVIVCPRVSIGENTVVGAGPW